MSFCKGALLKPLTVHWMDDGGHRRRACEKWDAVAAGTGSLSTGHMALGHSSGYAGLV